MTDEAKNTIKKEIIEKINQQSIHHDNLLEEKKDLELKLDEIDKELKMTQDVLIGLREICRRLD